MSCVILNHRISTKRDQSIRLALEEQFDNNKYGLRRAGLAFDLTMIRPPAVAGFADPKMWIWLVAHDTEGHSVRGVMHIDVIKHRDNLYSIASFITESDIHTNPSILNSFFSESEIRKIKLLLSR